MLKVLLLSIGLCSAIGIGGAVHNYDQVPSIQRAQVTINEFTYIYGNSTYTNFFTDSTLVDGYTLTFMYPKSQYVQRTQKLIQYNIDLEYSTCPTITGDYYVLSNSNTISYYPLWQVSIDSSHYIQMYAGFNDTYVGLCPFVKDDDDLFYSIFADFNFYQCLSSANYDSSTINKVNMASYTINKHFVSTYQIGAMSIYWAGTWLNYTNIDRVNYSIYFNFPLNTISNPYQDGYTAGFDNGNSQGYSTGYDNGYTSGYNVGVDEGVHTGNTLGNLFLTIADIPIRIIHQMTNFELFGVTFFVGLMSLLTLPLLVFIVKKVLNL